MERGTWDEAFCQADHERFLAGCVDAAQRAVDGLQSVRLAARVAHQLADDLTTMSEGRVPVSWETDHCPGFRIYVGHTRTAPVVPAVVAPARVT